MVFVSLLRIRRVTFVDVTKTIGVEPRVKSSKSAHTEQHQPRPQDGQKPGNPRLWPVSPNTRQPMSRQRMSRR